MPHRFAYLAGGIGLILGRFLRLSVFFAAMLNALFMFAGQLGTGLNPEMIILELLVLTGPSAAVHAVSADRYVLPKLRGHVPAPPGFGHHAPAH